MQADVIIRVRNETQIGQDVLDLFTIVELDSADDGVFNIRFEENFLHDTGLCIGPIQDGKVGVFPLSCIHHFLDFTRYELSFGLFRIRSEI